MIIANQNFRTLRTKADHERYFRNRYPYEPPSKWRKMTFKQLYGKRKQEIEEHMKWKKQTSN